MAKRREKEPPPAWDGYRPHEAEYWYRGGPWIPPDRIEAGGHSPRAENLRPYEKPETRRASVAKMLVESEANLAKLITHYVDLHERGVEAIPYEWMRDDVKKGYRPNEPNGLHRQFCNTYRDIAQKKAEIPVYRAVLDSLEPAMMPLFNQPKKP